jgi:hypothetical protein
MDWKEGLWVAVIAAGGAVSAIFELAITRYVQQQAAIAAHAETQKLLAQAAQAQAAARAVSAHPPNPPSQRQEENLGYVTIM